MGEYKFTDYGYVIRLSDGACPAFPPTRPTPIMPPIWRGWRKATCRDRLTPLPDNSAEAVRAQMRALEDQQARAVRECLLALADQGVTLPADAAARLTSIEQQIAALRAQL